MALPVVTTPQRPERQVVPVSALLAVESFGFLHMLFATAIMVAALLTEQTLASATEAATRRTQAMTA